MLKGRYLFGLGAAVTLAAGLGAWTWLTGAGQSGAAAVSERAQAMAMLDDLLALSDEARFERPSGSWRLSLPDDYGAHPDARAEAWMIAAHLEDAAGEAIGVQVSFLRLGLRRADDLRDADPWEVRRLHQGQAVLSMAGAASGMAEERFSRGLGAAGHDAAAREIWLDHWQLRYGEGPDGNALTLSASVGDVPVRLEFMPEKAPVEIAPDVEAPVRGFSMTRMRVAGVIGRGEAAAEVSGTAWLDRLWGELPLPGGPLVRDRLLLQLDDGTDLSLVRARRRDGRGVSTVDGVRVDADGAAEALSGDRIEVIATAHWSPDGSEGAYPVAWRVSGGGVDLSVAPVIDDQAHDLSMAGWSGIVRAEGTHRDAPVMGYGTLQLGGYENR